MKPREIAIPRLLSVGRECLARLGDLLQATDFHGRRLLVVSGSGPSQSFARTVAAGLRDDAFEVLEVTDLTGRLEQAADVAATVISEGTELLIAVGGGRVIDTGKFAAARTATPFVSVPTTLSHDGITSPVASLLDQDGTRRSYAATMPAGVVVDIGVVGSAPARTLRSGLGDLCSNLTALLDWRLAENRGQDSFDAFSAMIAESAVRPVLDFTTLTDAQSHELLAKGLILSGLAMAAAGTSRPCSGGEHLISHSLDAALKERAAMHGEQVALGCLVSATAHQSSLAPILHDLFRRLGLPTHPIEIGMCEDDFVEAIRLAPSTRPDRYTILTQLTAEGADLSALVRAAFDHEAGEGAKASWTSSAGEQARAKPRAALL